VSNIDIVEHPAAVKIPGIFRLFNALKRITRIGLIAPIAPEHSTQTDHDQRAEQVLACSTTT
jgi:hypothetical protein